MQPTYQNNASQSTPTNTGTGSRNQKIMAIISLILGVINLCAWFLPICGIPISITGLVLGYLGMKDPSQKTLAMIGMILCAIGLTLGCGNSAYGAYSGFTHALRNSVP
jgi:hypothetical protein